MATTVTRYVNTGSSAGGDGTTNATTGPNRAYPSLSAALTAQQQNLVTNDRVLELLCDGTLADTTAVNFSGYTTDATRYISIKVLQANRPLGAYDASKYRLEVGGSASGCIEVAVPHVRIEGLQIVPTGNDPENARGVFLNAGAGGTGADVRILNCIICYKPSGTPTTSPSNQGVRSNIADSNIRLTVANCLIYDFTSYGIFINHSGTSGVYVLYNNTICDNGVGMYLGGYGTTESLYVKNNIICHNTGTQYDLDGSTWNTYVTATNVTSDTSSPDGASYRSLSPSFVDRGNDNYHLATGDTTSKDRGTDLSGDAQWSFTDDIDGGTRPASWDIGADEEGVGYSGGGGPGGGETGFNWGGMGGGFQG